jgi:hypothetical protein
MWVEWKEKELNNINKSVSLFAHYPPMTLDLRLSMHGFICHTVSVFEKLKIQNTRKLSPLKLRCFSCKLPLRIWAESYKTELGNQSQISII